MHWDGVCAQVFRIHDHLELQLQMQQGPQQSQESGAALTWWTPTEAVVDVMKKIVRGIATGIAVDAGTRIIRKSGAAAE